MTSSIAPADLSARAEHYLAAVLADGRPRALADVPRAWPLTRPVLRSAADRMVVEGRLVRLTDRAGPPRFARPVERP